MLLLCLQGCQVGVVRCCKGPPRHWHMCAPERWFAGKRHALRTVAHTHQDQSQCCNWPWWQHGDNSSLADAQPVCSYTVPEAGVWGLLNQHRHSVPTCTRHQDGVTDCCVLVHTVWGLLVWAHGSTAWKLCGQLQGVVCCCAGMGHRWALGLPSPSCISTPVTVLHMLCCIKYGNLTQSSD